jgi:hypothetical protein
MDAEAPRLQAGEGLRCQQVKQSVVGAISMNGWSWLWIQLVNATQ